MIRYSEITQKYTCSCCQAWSRKGALDIPHERGCPAILGGPYSDLTGGELNDGLGSASAASGDNAGKEQGKS